ncbi:PolyA polymerase reg subunit [Cedratvirus Zaza IHUMI]|uniref:PolyA polymerase reg subunit n=1 Tax=Cedratvirus Zaza IHUMI TaxID=2126979 RepID=A0A2R8FCT9_9VIRU|nr:PolyA polymerase reg subunit [Cedratvirus Zaza IHUMI]
MHRTSFRDEDFLLPNQVSSETLSVSEESISVEMFSEIEFLSRFWKGENAYLVYVAPQLSSLPFLAKLFPNIKFHAYSSREESSGNLIYHKEEFSDELAQGWRNTRLLYPVYFICYSNLEKERLWHQTIKPVFSFLCLTYTRKYLSGYLFVQPNDSQQVMLVPEEKEKTYNKNFLQRIAYYHQVTRRKEFIMEGETFSFDQAYRLQVLGDYLNKTKARKSSPKEVLSLLKELTGC